MKRFSLPLSAMILATMALSGPALAQSGGSQAGASSATQAAASAGPVNAQAQSSGSANAGPAATQLDDATSVHAVLQHSVDSRKCKPGDSVTAKVTEDVKQNGEVVIHKGSTLEGHVTQATTKTKGESESSLGIAFDHARMKNGQEVPLQLGVQALASAETASTASVNNDFAPAGAMGSASGGARSTGGGLVGGAGSGVGSTVGAAGSAAGSTAGGVGRTVGSVGGTASAATSATGSVTGQVGGLDAAGHLTSDSSGVFGLQGMSLASNLSNATQGSVVTSTGKSVQLSSGTQMVLRAAKQ